MKLIDADITLEHSTAGEQKIQDRLNYYYKHPEYIDLRLAELDYEWDLWQVILTRNAVLTVTGVVLSLTSGKKWLALPVAASLITAWQLLKPGFTKKIAGKIGLRSRTEIEKEKYALKAIRGDFSAMIEVPNAAWNAVNL